MRTEKGCPFGSHRASGGLPQPAEVVDADPNIWANEMLIDVEMLNLDSSSMRQIAEACGGRLPAMRERIIEIVDRRGKMHNPVTGSGGILIGRVAEIGNAFPAHGLKIDDPIATMVSLSLTPLRLSTIEAIDVSTAQVRVRGTAVLFESGLYVKLPKDIDRRIALAVCDVAGAPATVLRMVRPGQTVAVLGGAGKAGLLCLFAARRRIGPNGRLIALDADSAACDAIRALGVADEVATVDLRDAIVAHRVTHDLTGGRLADVAINTTNVSGTEGATILSTRQRGQILFFGMATSFQTAALTAEGVGRDVEMIIGNGYVEGWTDETFELVRSELTLAAELARRFHPPAP